MISKVWNPKGWPMGFAIALPVPAIATAVAAIALSRRNCRLVDFIVFPEMNLPTAVGRESVLWIARRARVTCRHSQGLLNLLPACRVLYSEIRTPLYLSR